MKEKSSNKTSPMSRLRHESRENYLEAIYLLSEENNGAVRSVWLAEFMGFSKASICRAISVLKEEGYVAMDDDCMVSLTEIGKTEAKHVYDKHCYFERQLLAAGVDRETAKLEACRLEHAISHSSFEKLRLAERESS